MGENGVGQVLGRSSQAIIKEPFLLTELSNKGIIGINATK